MTSVYYNFELNNKTDLPILLDKTEQRDSPILKNASDYKLSIVKFNLPASNVESFVIDNQNDYLLQLASTYLSDGAPQTYQTAKYSLSLLTSNEYQMLTYQDFIENFNRRSLLCYRAYLTAFDITYNNVRENSGTITTASTYQTGTVNKTVPITTTFTNSYVGHLNLALTFNPYTDAQPIYQDSNDLFEIYLVNPLGVSCLVCSNLKLPKDGVKVINFDDSSIIGLTSQDLDDILPSNNYHPCEPFLKFCDRTNSSGNWIIRVKNKSNNVNHSFQYNIEYFLRVWFLPENVNGNQMEVIDTAPSLDINGNDKIELNFPETMILSGATISFSPKLNELLGFSSILKADGFYQVKLPQYRLSTSLKETIQYPQPISTLYKLTDISEIQIRSSNLPIVSEFDVTSSTQIVMSLNTASTDINKSVYEFFNQNLIDRSYQLTNNQDLRQINYSVWVKYRSSGKSKQVYLPPHSTFSILTKFIKNNENYDINRSLQKGYQSAISPNEMVQQQRRRLG